MSRLLVLIAASALTPVPAVAQHGPHAPAAASTCTPEHAAMGHCTLPGSAAPEPHAGHAMPTDPPTDDPHAGHDMSDERISVDPHSGHAMPAQSPADDPHAGHAAHGEPPSVDPHAGHDMSGQAGDVPLGPPPPEALLGPAHAGDAVWGGAAMDASRAVLFRVHGDTPVHKVLIDQLEARVRPGHDGYFLAAEGWYGGDLDKLWLKAEVEGDFGRQAEQAEFQALWSHAIGPWFDVQAGLRLDAEPDARGHLVFGVQGLAPYWIEVDAAAFVSDKGEVTARFEAEHDTRLTRALVLQPRAEIEFALQDVPRRHVGSGLSTAELGLRLRYEIVPNFAPYIGVHYEQAFGDTRRFLKAEGEDSSQVNFVAGIRTWF